MSQSVRNCILKNVRKFTQKLGLGLLCTDSIEYQFCSSLAAQKSASTLRLFWLQSQLLNLAGEPDRFSLLLQFPWLPSLCVVISHMNNAGASDWHVLESERKNKCEEISFKSFFFHSFIFVQLYYVLVCIHKTPFLTSKKIIACQILCVPSWSGKAL